MSDLHMVLPENRELIENLWPESAANRLLAAGDVAERFADIVYGHPYIPRTTRHDAARFNEVSLGYPPERRTTRRGQGRPGKTRKFPGSPG